MRLLSLIGALLLSSCNYEKPAAQSEDCRVIKFRAGGGSDIPPPTACAVVCTSPLEAYKGFAVPVDCETWEGRTVTVSQ